MGIEHEIKIDLFHSRMIREENTHLRKTIEERDKQLTDLEDLRRMGRQQRRELQEAQAIYTPTSYHVLTTLLTT